MITFFIQKDQKGSRMVDISLNNKSNAKKNSI